MQRRFLHRFQAPARSPIFVPTLSAADNQAFLSRTETNITKKKDLSRPLVNQNTSLEHLAAAAAVAIVRTQGWAGGLNDNIQRGPPSRPSLSNPKEMQKGLLFVASLSQSQCSPKTSFLTARSIARLVNRETSVPAGPLASTPVTATRCACCGNLRCRRGPREKSTHSGENCILVYNAKAVLPPVSGSCTEPYFCPNSVSC